MDTNLIEPKDRQALSDKIINMYEEYIKDTKLSPRYVSCEIQFLDDMNKMDVEIKLLSDYSEDCDGQVFYFCKSLNDLVSLIDYGVDNFILTDCFEFYE